MTEITIHCCVSYLCLQPSHHLRGTASVHKDIPVPAGPAPPPVSGLDVHRSTGMNGESEWKSYATVAERCRWGLRLNHPRNKAGRSYPCSSQAQPKIRIAEPWRRCRLWTQEIKLQLHQRRRCVCSCYTRACSFTATNQD